LKTAIIKQKYESEGDLGTVAKASKAKQRTLSFGVKPQTTLGQGRLGRLSGYFENDGAQSQKLKVDQIKKLLVRAQGPEAKYIIRGLQGKLRIGLARSTVFSSAHAFCATPPKGVQEYSDDDRTTNDETTHVPEELSDIAIASHPRPIGWKLPLPLSKRHIQKFHRTMPCWIHF
jgi:DNA ligase-1